MRELLQPTECGSIAGTFELHEYCYQRKCSSESADNVQSMFNGWSRWVLPDDGLIFPLANMDWTSLFSRGCHFCSWKISNTRKPWQRNQIGTGGSIWREGTNMEVERENKLIDCKFISVGACMYANRAYTGLFLEPFTSHPYFLRNLCFKRMRYCFDWLACALYSNNKDSVSENKPWRHVGAPLQSIFLSILTIITVPSKLASSGTSTRPKPFTLRECRCKVIILPTDTLISPLRTRRLEWFSRRLTCEEALHVRSRHKRSTEQPYGQELSRIIHAC